MSRQPSALCESAGRPLVAGQGLPGLPRPARARQGLPRPAKACQGLPEPAKARFREMRLTKRSKRLNVWSKRGAPRPVEACRSLPGPPRQALSSRKHGVRFVPNFPSSHLPVSTSPRLPVSMSPRLSVSTSPRLRVSTSPRLHVSTSPRLHVSTSPRLHVSVTEAMMRGRDSTPWCPRRLSMAETAPSSEKKEKKRPVGHSLALRLHARGLLTSLFPCCRCVKSNCVTFS